MHSAVDFRTLKSRLLPAGFQLFLAKVSGLVLLWLAIWAALAASATIENPRFNLSRTCPKENADVYVSRARCPLLPTTFHRTSGPDT